MGVSISLVLRGESETCLCGRPTENSTSWSAQGLGVHSASERLWHACSHSKASVGASRVEPDPGILIWAASFPTGESRRAWAREGAWRAPGPTPELGVWVVRRLLVLHCTQAGDLRLPPGPQLSPEMQSGRPVARRVPILPGLSPACPACGQSCGPCPPSVPYLEAWHPLLPSGSPAFVPSSPLSVLSISLLST